MKMKLLGLLLAVTLVLGCALPAFAGLHVFDANEETALSDEQRRALETKAQQLEDTYDVYAMVTLTDDLGSYDSAEAWALAELNAERGGRDGIVLGLYASDDGAVYTTQTAGDGAAARFPAAVLDAFEKTFAVNTTYYAACSSFYAVVETALAGAAAAETPAPAAEALHVFDAAYLLKAETRAALETRAAGIEADTGFVPMILLCSAEDLNGADPTAYAETRFAAATENEDGLVLLVSIESDEREHLSLVPVGRGVYYFDSDRLDAFEAQYDATETYADAGAAFLDFTETTLRDAGWSKEGILTRLQRSGAQTHPLLVDDAGLLSAADAAALQVQLQTYSDELGCDFVFVTTNATEGMEIQSYADRFFDALGYGRGEDRSGVLFLMRMEDRAWWISTTGEAANKAFGAPRRSEAAVEKVAGLLHENNYAAALPRLADTLYKGVKKVVHPFVSPLWLIVTLGAAFVISYLIQKGRAASLKSVRQQADATSYIVPDSLDLTAQSDDFLDKDTSRSAIPKSTSSSSSRGSSSGGHGGGGGHF